jgi:hypothetical protein
MAGTTRLELANSAVTVIRTSVLSSTQKITDGTASPWKHSPDKDFRRDNSQMKRGETDRPNHSEHGANPRPYQW